jgi:hypothetical protein
MEHATDTKFSKFIAERCKHRKCNRKARFVKRWERDDKSICTIQLCNQHLGATIKGYKQLDFNPI